MATPIDCEPQLRLPSLMWRDAPLCSGRRRPLPHPILLSNRSFLDVLQSRRSAPGSAAISDAELSSLLWHSMMVRERQPARDGYLGWESRVCPSAGGLHPISVLCLPIGNDLPCGQYDPIRHEIVDLDTQRAELLAANASNVDQLCGAKSGVTIQFVADRSKVDAAYMNGASLLWRDAGALLAVVCLTAECLNLVATPLGRTGHDVLSLLELSVSRWQGVGALHLSTRD